MAPSHSSPRELVDRGTFPAASLLRLYNVTKPKGSGTLLDWSGNGPPEASSVCLLMPKIPSEGSGHFALRRRVNRLLAERGADVRIAETHSAAEREILGDYFLVRFPIGTLSFVTMSISWSSRARSVHWRAARDP